MPQPADSAAATASDEARTGPVLGLVAVAHLALLAYMLGVRALLQTGTTVDTLLRGTVVNWDVVHFLRIAREGYVQAHLAVLLPLHPLILKVTTILVRHEVWAGLLVALLAHLASARFLMRLWLLDQPAPIARSALLFSLVFPTAFCVVVPYSESPFLLFAAATLYYFRRQRMVLAGLFGFLAVTTRLPGLALLAAMLAEYVSTMRREVPLKRVLFPLTFPCLGFALYLLMNAAWFGDPLFFLRVQTDHFYRVLGWPWQGLTRAVNMAVLGSWPANFTEGINEVAGGLLAWSATVYAFLRLRRSDAVYCAASAVLFTFQGFWVSNLRYCYVVFPMYVMLARLSRREWLRQALLAACLVWLAFLSLQFARGWWAG